MTSCQDLGRLIAGQAVHLEAGEVAELRRLVGRVRDVWRSPDGDRLAAALVGSAARLGSAARALRSFGRRIEAEAAIGDTGSGGGAG